MIVFMSRIRVLIGPVMAKRILDKFDVAPHCRASGKEFSMDAGLQRVAKLCDGIVAMDSKSEAMATQAPPVGLSLLAIPMEGFAE